MRPGGRTSPPSEADTAILAHKPSATRTQAQEQVWCEKPWRAELVAPTAPFPPTAQRPRAALSHCTGQGQCPSGGLGEQGALCSSHQELHKHCLCCGRLSTGECPEQMHSDKLVAVPVQQGRDLPLACREIRAWRKERGVLSCSSPTDNTAPS